MHADKKDSDVSTVCSWSPELAKLNSAFSRVARRSLPAAPSSRPLRQDILRHWERAAREQTVMSNQAAGLSRCLTRVQDAMSTQLKSLHMVKGKGKSSGRMQQAVDELEYVVTFNRSISQVMARTMQDLSEGVFISVTNFTLPCRESYLSEGVFISVTNFTLPCRESYLEYLHVGVKQDTLHCVLLPFICSHLYRTSFSLRLNRKWPEVKRGVHLASHTGNQVVSIHMERNWSWQAYNFLTETGQGFKTS